MSGPTFFSAQNAKLFTTHSLKTKDNFEAFVPLNLEVYVLQELPHTGTGQTGKFSPEITHTFVNGVIPQRGHQLSEANGLFGLA